MIKLQNNRFTEFMIPYLTHPLLFALVQLLTKRDVQNTTMFIFSLKYWKEKYWDDKL